MEIKGFTGFEITRGFLYQRIVRIYHLPLHEDAALQKHSHTDNRRTQSSSLRLLEPAAVL